MRPLKEQHGKLKRLYAGMFVPGMQSAARGRFANDGALAPQRVPRTRLARLHRGHHAGPGGRRLRARAVPQDARKEPQGVQGTYEYCTNQ